DAEHDLVQVGVVGDRVDVRPVRLDALGLPAGGADVTDGAQLFQLLRLGDHGGDRPFAEVDVDQLRVGADVPMIRLRRVEILNEVVPGVPFPDDLAFLLAGRLDFEQRVGHQLAVADGFRPAAGVHGFLGGLLFPHDYQDVTVGQLADVVVGQFRFAGIRE